MIISGNMKVHQVEKGKVKFNMEPTEGLHSKREVIVDSSFLPEGFTHEKYGIRARFMFKFEVFPKY